MSGAFKALPILSPKESASVPFGNWKDGCEKRCFPVGEDWFDQENSC